MNRRGFLFSTLLAPIIQPYRKMTAPVVNRKAIPVVIQKAIPVVIQKYWVPLCYDVVYKASPLFVKSRQLGMTNLRQQAVEAQVEERPFYIEICKVEV